MLPLLFSAALAAPVAPATDASVHVLDNGLVVVLEQQTRTDETALYLKYRVGSRDERDGEHGAAHLFEHLMFEGSANVPRDMFDTWLTAGGGSNNAWTSEDETVYHMTFPSGALDLALFLESDRMGFLDAGLDAENLANQQAVVMQERRQGYAEPHGRDMDVLTTLLYGEGHPYHVPVIGTVADVEGFSVDGARLFWRRHYRPRNAVLVVVGPHPDAHVLARVRHWFSDVPDSGEAEPRPGATDPAPTRRDGVLFDRVEDRTVYLAWPGVPAGHADEAALDLLASVLSAGRGTRLDDALYYRRDLVTDIGAAHYTGDIAGQFQIVATSPDQPLPDLVARIDREVARLVRRGVHDDELERARRGTASWVRDMLESPGGRANILMYCYELHGDPDCVDDLEARWAAVTPADVVDVARRYLDGRPRVTLSVVPEGDEGAMPGAVPMELP